MTIQDIMMSNLTQMTISMMRARQRQASSIEDTAKRDAAWKWAIRGEYRTRLNKTQALARSVPLIRDEGVNWDTKSFLLGVHNGVVDLSTGHFRKATAADRVTMRARVAYDFRATCPLWLQTLQGILPRESRSPEARGSTLVSSVTPSTMNV
jgi:phage/plasmid-associated DNA primase